jgi:hypothetical protein
VHTHAGSETGPLKALVVREAVTLARRRKIRTLCKLHRKLLRSPLSFQNCTKLTKYEALEKNVVSNRKLPSLRQSPRSMAERVGFELTVRYLWRLSPLISAIIHANEQLSCSEMTGFRA